MYEKVATVTMSIEETASLGQGERGPDRDSFFPNPVSYLPTSYTLCPHTTAKVVSVDNFAPGTKDRLSGYREKQAG